MPDIVKEGDKKEDLSLLEKADKKESEVKKKSRKFIKVTGVSIADLLSISALLKIRENESQVSYLGA